MPAAKPDVLRAIQKRQIEDLKWQIIPQYRVPLRYFVTERWVLYALEDRKVDVELLQLDRQAHSDIGWWGVHRNLWLPKDYRETIVVEYKV
jgi:hypothetical protein